MDPCGGECFWDPCPRGTPYPYPGQRRASWLTVGVGTVVAWTVLAALADGVVAQRVRRWVGKGLRRRDLVIGCAFGGGPVAGEPPLAARD